MNDMCLKSRPLNPASKPSNFLHYHCKFYTKTPKFSKQHLASFKLITILFVQLVLTISKGRALLISGPGATAFYLDESKMERLGRRIPKVVTLLLPFLGLRSQFIFCPVETDV